MPRLAPVALVFTAVLLAGCDMLGIESADSIAAARSADGKAIGAACRHAGRAIEDCYTLYRKADRASIFAGWRDMNDYMRENKIDPVVPQLALQPAPLKSAADRAPDPVSHPATDRSATRAGAARLQTAAQAKEGKAADS